MDKPFKILIIDDEASIVELLNYMIERNPSMKATTTTDPADAMTFMDNEKFDLVLTDFHMPKLNGGQLVRYTRLASLQNKDTPILFITSNPEKTEEFVKTFERIHILQKPVSVKKLSSYIIKTLMAM